MDASLLPVLLHPLGDAPPYLAAFCRSAPLAHAVAQALFREKDPLCPALLGLVDQAAKDNNITRGQLLRDGAEIFNTLSKFSTGRALYFLFFL